MFDLGALTHTSSCLRDKDSGIQSSVMIHRSRSHLTSQLSKEQEREQGKAARALFLCLFFMHKSSSEHTHIFTFHLSKNSCTKSLRLANIFSVSPRGSGRPAVCCLYNKTISKRRGVVKANTLPGPALAHDVDVAQGCERVRAQRPRSSYLVVSSKRFFLFFCTASLGRSEEVLLVKCFERGTEQQSCRHAITRHTVLWLIIYDIRRPYKRLEERVFESRTLKKKLGERGSRLDRRRSIEAGRPRTPYTPHTRTRVVCVCMHHMRICVHRHLKPGRALGTASPAHVPSSPALRRRQAVALQFVPARLERRRQPTPRPAGLHLVQPPQPRALVVRVRDADGRCRRKAGPPGPACGRLLGGEDHLDVDGTRRTRLVEYLGGGKGGGGGGASVDGWVKCVCGWG